MKYMQTIVVSWIMYECVSAVDVECEVIQRVKLMKRHKLMMNEKHAFVM
jgi:hypothetical protein